MPDLALFSPWPGEMGLHPVGEGVSFFFFFFCNSSAPRFLLHSSIITFPSHGDIRYIYDETLGLGVNSVLKYKIPFREYI